MLEDYAEKNGFTGIRHFTDDGISGTTFEREGLQAMLAEVEKGNIGTIIVKDMSRLGRNYVQMGMLREQLRVGLWQNREIKNPYKWGSSTIAHILQKHEYLGHTVNFKTRKHFRDKKSHYVDKDQWLIFEDTPAPIIDQETFDNVQRIPMYVCGNYAKQPVGTLCRSAHRIKADHVMEIAAKTIREVVKYANLDKKRFAEEIQSHIEDRQTVDFTEQKKRMVVCEKRIGELEMLIAKIYEDNALGKLSDKRYTMLYNQYEGEQEQLQNELDGYKTEQAQYENDRKSAARFLKLVERYSSAEEMTTLMLNEFVEKIVVHERDRKGSADTTQKIEVYFNFIGEYIPPTMAEKEPTAEELEEIRKKEARKDRLHQNYLKRKASGKQKEYEERTKAKKKAQIDSQKEQIRAEDREKGVYFHAGVPNIPRANSASLNCKQAVM